MNHFIAKQLFTLVSLSALGTAVSHYLRFKKNKEKQSRAAERQSRCEAADSEEQLSRMSDVAETVSLPAKLQLINHQKKDMT